MRSGIKPEWSGYVWLHRLLDSVLPVAVLVLITKFFSVPWHDRYSLLGLMGGFIFVTLNQFIGTYERWKGRSFSTSIRMVFKSWLITWVLLVIIAFMFKRSVEYSRLVTFNWAFVTFLVLVGYRGGIRLFLAYYRKKGLHVRKVAIVGDGKIGCCLADIMQKNSYLGYQVVGFYDDNQKMCSRRPSGITLCGDTKQAVRDAQEGKFHELYLCLSLGAEERIIALLNELADSSVIVKYVPDFFAFDLLHAQWGDLKGIPVVSVYDSPMSSTSARCIKRIEDIVIASLIMLVVWPLMALIAIGVKLSSPGPVFYRQTRVGWNGQPFTILKFRTMVVHSEDGIVTQATSDDKRVTRFGRLLRKTSLDELPQLINVLCGQMSLVGPRPHALLHHEYYNRLIDKYMQRHLIKPGLTGYAQINGLRGETRTVDQMAMRVEKDRYYISNWSLMMDLKIIIVSALRGWTNKNAY